MKQRLALLFLILLTTPVVVLGQSLGVHGTLYDIQEEDAVVYLKRRFNEWEKDGTIKQRQQEAIDRVQNTVHNPPPVAGITNATESRTHYFDPTTKLDKPLTDAKGRIIYPAGTTVNPLHYGGLSKRYVFIDAREPTQVRFALEGLKDHPTDKIVLTGGSWVTVSQKAGTQVFYDQSGYLTRRFGIKHVPAIVQQDGARLRVEERKL